MILAVCVALGGALGSALWWQTGAAGRGWIAAASASAATGALAGIDLRSDVLNALLGFGAFSAAAPMIAALYPLPDLSVPDARTRIVKSVARRLTVGTVVCASCAAAGYLTVVVLVTALRKLGLS